MTVRVAIDCMGGDHGAAVTLPAARCCLNREPAAQLLLVGRRDTIEHETRNWRSDERRRITIHHAAEVVGMDEPPAQALRGKRDSSMRIAIDLVKAGEAGACVSAGNTGALMAMSRFVLKMLEGIDRPAIATQIPNRTGGTTTMLDLGANVDCTPENLLQFGIMGAALVTALDGLEQPRVGLLNIGEEVIKGNDVVKQAAELLRSSSLNFVGNVEGDDIYNGTVDVVVCDGFVGNVALKTSEGLAQMLADIIREEYTRHPLTRAMALLSYPVLKRFKRRVDHRRYNGASLIGLRGVVIKSHGSADVFAFDQALRRACDAVRNGLLDRIASNLPKASTAPTGVSA